MVRHILLIINSQLIRPSQYKIYFWKYFYVQQFSKLNNLLHQTNKVLNLFKLTQKSLFNSILTPLRISQLKNNNIALNHSKTLPENKLLSQTKQHMDHLKNRFKKFLQFQTEPSKDQDQASLSKIITQKEQQSKQNSFLHFKVPNFFKKLRQESNQNQNQDVSKNQSDTATTARQVTDEFEVETVKIKDQTEENDTNLVKQIKTQTQTEVQKVIVTNDLYKFLQDQVQKQPPRQNLNQQQTRSDDQDSLGYTQNDWDQQSINFQLQDRMLDCLQDQRHAFQYRQSLAQSSFMRKRIDQRLSKPNRPPSPKENDFEQMDFQKIIQQHTTGVANTPQNKVEEKTPNKQQVRRNRFSKYKKRQENETNQQKKTFNTQEQEKLQNILKQKMQKLQAQGDQTCDDYIDRVFKIKTYEQLKPIKSKQDKNQDKVKQKDVNVTFENGMDKKQSINSEGSFQVVQQIRHLNMSQITKKQSENSQQQDPKSKLQNNQKQNIVIVQQQSSKVQNQSIRQKHQKDQITKQNQKNVQFQTKQEEKISLKFYSNKNLPIVYSPIKKSQKVIQSPLKNNNFQFFTSENPNFIKIKPSPQTKPQIGKSPRAKIQFNYVNLNQNQQPKFVSVNQKPNFIALNPRQKLGVNKIAAQPQERIPIFLQRLRRLISVYPNFQSSNMDLRKIQDQLKTILNGMKSAILVIELLYKKMAIQRNRLQQIFILINQRNSCLKIQTQQITLLDNQILDLFMNSGWQNYRIEEIEFIKPKQNFKRRVLNLTKMQEALQMYSEFINFYLTQPILMTNNRDEIQRYFRIRQKISEIVQYLRMISEDIYSYWLVDCHYPQIYSDFLQFLRQDKQQKITMGLKDEIYAKLIQIQQYNDPVSLSIIGKKIHERIVSQY